MKMYLVNLGEFFKCKATKEEFDLSARRLLNPEQVRLHNEFLLAMLTKCQAVTAMMQIRETPAHLRAYNSDLYQLKQEGGGLSSDDHSVLRSQTSGRTAASPSKSGTQSRERNLKMTLKLSEIKGGAKVVSKVKKKLSAQKASFENRFQPVNVLRQAPTVQQTLDSYALEFCTQSALLPDAALIQGRLFVTAWENGLETVEDECVQLVMAALMDVLKNILAAAIGQQKGYRLRENRFPYAYGVPHGEHYQKMPVRPFGQPDTYGCALPTDGWMASVADAEQCQLGAPLPVPHHLRQAETMTSARQAIECGQGDAAMDVSLAGSQAPPHEPMTCSDLFTALQTFRNVIKSHTIYALNLERIGNRMWHPSNEEISSEQLYARRDVHSGVSNTAVRGSAMGPSDKPR